MKKNNPKSRPETLKRLGSVPYWRGEKRFDDIFAPIYAKVAEKAKKKLETMGADDAENENND